MLLLVISHTEGIPIRDLRNKIKGLEIGMVIALLPLDKNLQILTGRKILFRDGFFLGVNPTTQAYGQ